MNAAWKRGAGLALAAVLLALLAGCGGGGGQSAVDRTRIATLEAELEEADQARLARLEAQSQQDEANQTLIDALEDEKEQAEAGLEAAQEGIAARDSVLAAINARLAALEQVEDDTTTTTTTATTTHAGLFPAGDEEEEDETTPTGTTPASTTTPASPQPQQLSEAEKAAIAARAAAWLSGDTPLDAPGEGMATVQWMRGGSLQFSVGAFTRGSVAPAVPGSWTQRGSFTGTGGTAASVVNETIYLYSNIGAPGTRPFWKVHNVAVDAPAEDNAASNPTPTAAAQFITDSTDSTMATGVRVSGTYSGVSGTYTCVVAACIGAKDTIALTGLVQLTNSVRSFADGDWSFKPSSIVSGIQQAQDDAYLYFGIWASDPVAVPGTPNFQYIAGGGAESGTDLNNFAALTGAATFTGGAVGRYATTRQVGQQSARIGTFTATATFTANFGDATDAGTLHGRLTDFRENGVSLPGWNLTLGATANVGNAVDITNAAVNGASTLTVGTVGDVPVNGMWGAGFYGMDNAVLADRVMYPATRYPVADLAGLTGWFDAQSAATVTTAIAGAFGATCTTGPCAR